MGKDNNKDKKSEYAQLSIFDFLSEMQEEMDAWGEEFDEDELAQMHVEEVTSMDLPLGWENVFDTDESTIGIEAASVSDGLIKSLNQLGCVDIEYISTITGKDYKTVIGELKGSIYQNPDTWGECFFKGWETEEEYISGNISSKLQSAYIANEEYNGYFNDNVIALEKALPAPVSPDDIYVTLGSPWVPVDVIREFVLQLFVRSSKYNYQWMKYGLLINVRHDDMTGTWEVEWPNYYRFGYDIMEKYGTKRRDPVDILKRTLNMQSVAVYDIKKSNSTKSGKVSVLNKEETVLAIEKQKQLIEDFQKWIWADEERKMRLLEIYEKKYLCIKQRHFNGSFLEFPNMNPDIELFPYQKNAVARILFTPNTLLAHDVGSGKTYVMIAAGMELRRMKQADKNLYVVPNNIIGQWKSIFLSMYPEAKILIVEPKNFTPAKRKDVLKEIRDEDYDGIIMAYSCFNQISISAKCQLEMLNLELKKLEETAQNPNARTNRILNRIEKLKEKKLEKQCEKEEDTIFFDELGISRLYVDEAHNFKNVPIDTKIDSVMGISKTGSKKCQDMMDKVRIVQRQNMGKGVVLATGTPITNSITDAYIMQSYLQSGQLAILELQSFDSWVGMFAEKTTNFEIDVDTSTYRMATRFSKFYNLPELTTMLASIADFHQVDDSAGIPVHNGYVDATVKKTKDFSEYLKYISKRAEDVRNGHISRSEDNMLKITTDGRKAALDLRLVDNAARFTVISKVFMCAENVASIYKNATASKSTQLIFCDTSTPKSGFNMYDELKQLLLKLKVDEKDIAYIHEATTESKREQLFEMVRKGEIRILIGSTFKLGLGVNVQDKLIALHHLDIPWRPADMVQREGRILRQGNENAAVQIFRYITEGSFDAYSWQLLETKQRFIADLLSGSIEQREGTDIDDTVLNYAEVKALAIGSPLIRERVELSNELSRFQILQRKLVAARLQYKKELSEMPELINRLRDLIPKCKDDSEFFWANAKEYDSDEKKAIRAQIHQATHTEEVTKEEQVVCEYQGFEVVVPARVSVVHPIIKLRRSGEYSVELTNTEFGGMQRIDRCLDDLKKRYEDLVKRLNDTLSKQKFMQSELDKNEDYVEKIMELKTKIEAIDKRLGVDKNE